MKSRIEKKHSVRKTMNLSSEDAYNLNSGAKGTVGGTVKDGSADEKFHFAGKTFDIAKARTMSKGRANAMIEPSSDWSEHIHVDKRAAMTSTSTKPVFVAMIDDGVHDGPMPLLIDGHHRMHKAISEGKKGLPAYVFSTKETKKLMGKVSKAMPGSSDVHVPAAGEEEPPQTTELGYEGTYSSGPANLEVEMIKTATEPEEQEGAEKRAAAADLITMPEDIDGTSCSNCKWVEGDYCKNPRVDLQLEAGADHMCCNFWDAEGTTRSWIKKDTSPTQMGSNYMDGLYDMQQIVSGVDWELEHGNAGPDMAKESALSNLADNPDYYRLKRLMDTYSDDKLTKDTLENEHASVSDWPVGLNLDLCSGACREPGYVGFDLYPYDYGTVVHDLSMGIPARDGSVSKVRIFDGLEHLPEEDQKPLLSEIHRVLMPGGEFVYQGPNDIWNYPDWEQDYPGLVLTGHEDNADDQVEKIEGQPTFRQTFTRIAVPDAATANDAEPRIGVQQFDMLPADALLAMDALGYSWSDATSSGRGNRLHGYPSQGALLNREEENAPNNVGMQKIKTKKNLDADPTDFALPDEGRYPIGDINQGIAALSACSGKAEEENVKNAVYRKFPELKGDSGQKIERHNDELGELLTGLKMLGRIMSVGKGNSWLSSSGVGGGDEGGDIERNDVEKDELTTEGRKRISDDNFAIPEERKYPIHDIEHARNALARVSQHGTDEEKKKVRSAVHRKYPTLEGDDVKKFFSQRVVPIKKAMPMKQVVYCVVLTPEELDAQDDWMTPNDIEDAAHIFMQHSREIGSNHERSIDAIPVESYIAPQDLHWNEGPYGPQVVKQGSWVIGIKVNDPGEWRKVLSGEYQGVSVGGFGLRL